MPEYNADPNIFLKLTTQKIIELAQITDGRTLVLFTAKEDLNFVYKELDREEEKVVWPVIKQRDGSSQNEIKQRFLKDKGILLGTGAFWEGFNIQGPDLSSVIIVRLPFPVPFISLPQ